jgi:hypothetical protein
VLLFESFALHPDSDPADVVVALAALRLKTLWKGTVDVVRTIQTRTRGWLAHVHYTRLQAKALLAQTNARRASDRRIYLRRKEAFVRLQAIKRRRQARHEYKDSRNGILVAQDRWRWRRVKRAADQLVRILRGRMQRRRYARVRSASVAIQAAARGRHDRKVVGAGRYPIYAAATAIQTFRRQKAATHSVRVELTARRVMAGALATFYAVLVQRHTRCLLAVRQGLTALELYSAAHVIAPRV